MIPKQPNVPFRTQILQIENKKYELKLVASDSLNENATTIIINVRDVNDLPPVFPQTLYERTLNEEMKAPFTIMQVGVLFFVLFFTFNINFTE